MCSLTALQNIPLESDTTECTKSSCGRRNCGVVSISLDEALCLKLHCLFCNYDSEYLDMFWNHLKGEHSSSLLAAGAALLFPDNVLEVKQEMLEVDEANICDDLKQVLEDAADPLMTSEENKTRKVGTDEQEFKNEYIDSEECSLSRSADGTEKDSDRTTRNADGSQRHQRPLAQHVSRIIDHLRDHPVLWNTQLSSHFIRAERLQAIESIAQKMLTEYDDIVIDSNYVHKKVNSLQHLYHNYHKKKSTKTKSERTFYGKLCFLKEHAPSSGDRKKLCTLCNKHFSFLPKHMQRHHQDNDTPQTCEICKDMLPSERHLKKHLRTVHQRYDCEYCVHETFPHAKSLLRHTKKAHPDKVELVTRRRSSASQALPKERICEYCGRQFKAQKNLNTHKKIVHLQLRPYKCLQCPKAYKRKEKLTSHMNSVHLNLRNHICEVCSKAFYDRKTLIQHKRLHSDVMNYVCKLCGQSFRQAPALHSHMKTHR